MLVPNYFYAPNTIERKSTGLSHIASIHNEWIISGWARGGVNSKSIFTIRASLFYARLSHPSALPQCRCHTMVLSLSVCHVVV